MDAQKARGSESSFVVLSSAFTHTYAHTMSRPPNPPSGRTAPARPQFKAAIPELVCKGFKPDGTPCEARFFTLKGYLSHGRSVKMHSAPGFVPPQPQPQTQAMTPPQQDDHPGLYVDGPVGLSDYSWLDTMPYVELLDLQVRGALIDHLLYPPRTHLLLSSPGLCRSVV